MAGTALQTVVVSDAGPLISLGRLDLLPVLRVLFAQVQVPQAVIVECMARLDNFDAERLRAALATGLLQPCTARPLVLAELDPGECEAISRALEIGAGLPTDDHAARLHAAAMGIAVMGTLGVLVRARRTGLVGPLLPLITTLRASGQRLGWQAVTQALTAVGEAPE